MLRQLNLAIVGHANAGKTSLLRALTRNVSFGVISDKPGTTRHVEAITLPLPQQQSIVFYDTPGLEDSISLYDYINNLFTSNEKIDGIDKLNRFLVSPEAELHFEQEAKVIRQLLKSDAAIYVIDVREPVLEKYHDELALLTNSNKPMLAILNFTTAEKNNEEAWKTLLARVGIHAIIRFDAIFPPFDGEKRLYQSLALLIEPAKNILDNWLEELDKQTITRNKSANVLIAETLVDITAYCETAKIDDKSAIESMQNKVRKREQKAIDSLLRLYQFDLNFESDANLPLDSGRYESDLFNLEALKLVGVQLSKGMISGAAIGAGIDLAVGGITLGAAALIGATIGGLTQTARHYGSRIKNSLSGYQKISVNDSIICFLSLRLIDLKNSLMRRSHANMKPITMTMLNESLWKKGALPNILKTARAHQAWSSLNKGYQPYDKQRQQVIDELSEQFD